MGHIFSRQSGFSHSVDENNEEDIADLIDRQSDSVTVENEEGCLQYLKRKFINLFCCQTSDRKRKRHIDDADDNRDNNKIIKVEEDICTEEPIEIVEEEVQNVQEFDNIHESDIENITCKENISDVTITKEKPYLDYPFLTEIPSMTSMQSSLTMIIMRGLPGSGKSTVVRKLKEVFPKASVCSADDFFERDGVYTFDRTKLKDAHQFSQDKAEELCQNLTNLIIIDNTNVKRWEMVPYFRTASQHRYTVILVEPKTPWKFDVDELIHKNTHSVDEAVIRTRVKDWQVVQPQYYGYFLNPADSSLLLDLGYSWLEKCLTNKEFFEDFSLFSNRYNLKSMLHYYSRNSMSKNSQDKCHCTTRFVKKGDMVESSQEVDMLGQASSVYITGFVITPRTFGARVQLTPSQLTVYKQNDNETESALIPSKPRPAHATHLSEQSSSSLASAISACSPSLTVEKQEAEMAVGAGQLLGRRAHITLGCADGVRPVQTGIDQLQVLREVDQPVTSLDIPGGTLAGFGDGRWLVSLDKRVEVLGVFSGSY